MTAELTTWGTVHAGDVVLGHDAQEWGVAEIDREAGRRDGAWLVVLVRHGERVRGWPTPAQPVSVVRRSDTSAEHAAAAELMAGLGPVEIINETWEN